MRELFYLVTTETSTASRHNKSKNLQQKCGTWVGQTPRQFLRRKLVEGPNNVLPWSADFKFRIYSVKSTSKFGKIGLLDDPGGQGSSSKDFICRLDLSNGLGLRPQKEKSRFGRFWTSQWAFEDPSFSPVVHRDSQSADGQKSISLSIS
jgi:hypothetical protein